MKKIITLIIALVAMMPTTLTAQEFYIVKSKQSGFNALTFYYDNQKSARSQNALIVYDSPTQISEKDKGFNSDNKIIIDASMANYKPKSMEGWFANFDIREDIEGIEYLNTSEVTNMHRMFYNSLFPHLDLSHFDTRKVTTMREMFRGCASLYYDVPIYGLVSVDLSSFNTSNVTDMSGMFYGCERLQKIDVSHFNTSNVTDMSYMFYGCKNKYLTTLDVSHFNTSNVTDMCSMFCECKSLTTLDVSHFNTSNVTDMCSMFCGCFSLTTLDVSHFNTSNVTDMSSMFEKCESLTTLDVSHFNTSNVTNMSYMFEECESLTTLDVSSFNTSNVTDMDSMFRICHDLTSLDVSHFNTSNVTDMSYMFEECESLTTLDVSNFNTSNVTDMDCMFVNCDALTILDVSSFNIDNVKDFDQMFAACDNLVTIYNDGSDWNTTGYVPKHTEDMFNHCVKLKGGNGTAYDENFTDGSYAHPDTPDNPGYFTVKFKEGTLGTQGTWRFEDGVLTIDYVGQMPWDCTSKTTDPEIAYRLKWIDLLSQIKEIVITGADVEIQPYFLYYSGDGDLGQHPDDHVRTLTLGSGVKKVGKQALALYDLKRVNVYSIDPPVLASDLGESNCFWKRRIQENQAFLYLPANAGIGYALIKSEWAYFNHSTNHLDMADDPVGIKRVTEDTERTEDTETLGGWYTLDGRKLSGKPMQKGIYIKDGKKRAVK